MNCNIQNQPTKALPAQVRKPAPLTAATLPDVLADNLQRANYQVLIARDSGQALQKAHQEQPDLIILDPMPPRLDGLEVCRALRPQRDVAIIIQRATPFSRPSSSKPTASSARSTTCCSSPAPTPMP